MSYLRTINEFLAETRELTIEQLNRLIQERDHTATELTQQLFAHSVLGYMQSASIRKEPVSFASAVEKAEMLRKRNGWLFIESSMTQPNIPVEVEQPPPKQSIVEVKSEKQQKVRKQDQAQAIYDALPDKTRNSVIAAFVEKLGVSEAGALTYFYNCGGSTGAKSDQPSKKELAQMLYDKSDNKDREYIIELFMRELGLTKPGAHTYYYGCGGAPVRKKI